MCWWPHVVLLALDAASGFASAAEARHYKKTASYVGQDFFSKWKFFDAKDPTHGTVEYLDAQAAKQAGLVNATADRVFMRADATSKTEIGRQSVRIESTTMYNSGLFVVDLEHIPTGCGAWPAFWMLGSDVSHMGRGWGEYDIVEGTHRSSHVMTGLHTAQGCDQSRVMAGTDFSSEWSYGLTKRADDCSIHAPGQRVNQGCSQKGPRNSMGTAFNDRGGGTFAAEWDPLAGHIRTWFWPRGSEPDDVAGQVPQPESWGLPYSYYRLDKERCPTSHFRNMRLIFDITFCGDLGETTFNQSCPHIASRMTCEDFVRNYPKAMEDAFWSIRNLDVYQKPGAPPTVEVSQRPNEARGSIPPGTLRRPNGHMPLSKQDPRDLFASVERKPGGLASPGAAFGNRQAPLPTNLWWANLVLAEDPTAPEANIFQMPYVILTDTASVHAMQPFPVSASAQSYADTDSIALGAIEELTGPIVEAWDELTLTLQWQGPDGASMRVPLARGSPFITAEFSKATPTVQSGQSLRPDEQGRYVVMVDDKARFCDGTTTLQGYVFRATLVESDSTWSIFAPDGMTWVCQPQPFALTALSPMEEGAVRAALVNSCTTGLGAHHCEGTPNGRDMSAYAELLSDYAGSYAVRSALGFEVDGDEGLVDWMWTTKSLPGWSRKELLQLAWPVHLPLLPKEVTDSAEAKVQTPFHDVRGRTALVVGDTWHLTYTLFPDVGIGAPRRVAPSMREELLRALKGSDALWNGSAPDSEFDLPWNYQLGVGDTYFSGKMLARLARTVAIAGELGEIDESYFKDMLRRLAKRVEVWLRKDAETPFLYDATWGGMVSCGCLYDDCWGSCTPHCANDAREPQKCPALEDAGMNFGNSIYNDHHFHYGYFVYAAAVVAKYDPAWERQWRDRILAIVRDYGNPSTQDPFFPLARHKDWFVGVSWAGGLAAMESGRNQESTSEAINAYYALYAYGASIDAPFAKHLKDFGRILTAMESHSADTYWHVRRDSDVYGNEFSQEHQVVGILWEHAALFQTWFGAEPYFVSGIQLLPYTPVMELYLHRGWVSEHFYSYEAECNKDPKCRTTGWSWPMCLEQAVIDPEAARTCIRNLPADAFGAQNSAACGNSLTNSLHWIATRPGQDNDGPPPPTQEPPIKVVDEIPRTSAATTTGMIDGHTDDTTTRLEERRTQPPSTTTVALTESLQGKSDLDDPTGAHERLRGGEAGREQPPYGSQDVIHIRKMQQKMQQ